MSDKNVVRLPKAGPPSPTQSSATRPHATTSQLSDIAYEKIKQDIRRCALAPGAVLSEGMLAARYDLGKAPIRNALTRLAQDGLVAAERRRGYRVSPITLEDVQHIFQLRLLIEPEAARLAAGRLTDAHVALLTAACDPRRPSGEKKSDAEFLEANRLFHVTIAAASGNRRLAQLTAQLLDDVERMLHLGLIDEPRGDAFQAEHKALLEALLANQADEAAQMVREQIEGGLAMVVQSVLNNPTLLAPEDPGG